MTLKECDYDRHSPKGMQFTLPPVPHWRTKGVGESHRARSERETRASEIGTNTWSEGLVSGPDHARAIPAAWLFVVFLFPPSGNVNKPRLA